MDVLGPQRRFVLAVTMVTVAFLFIALPSPLAARAQETAQAGQQGAASNEVTRDISRTSLRDLHVKLVDDDGQPVAGGLVMPYAMRLVETNGHGYWDREVLGQPVDYKSNEDGIATIRYPGNVYNKPKPFTTKLVTFQIRHFDFVTKVVHLDLGPDYDKPITETEVMLKRGCELEISAIDASGNVVEDYAVMMAGESFPNLWEKNPDGVRRTSALDDGTRQLLLVAPQPDGPILFSGLRPLRVRPSQALKIRRIKLRPGVTLTGKLADDVPRPVKNGYVIVTCAPRPLDDEQQRETLTWHDWAKVEDDGTFRVESLPRGGTMQAIAVCNDWVSKTNWGDRGSFVRGQLFDLGEELTDIEIQMERTGTLQLELVTPDGKPLESGKVSSWPNQLYYKGGSTLLGQRFRSLQIAQAQIGMESTIDLIRETPFLDQPVEAGRCTLRGIPIGKTYRLAIFHEDYKFQTVAGSEPSFLLKDEKPQKLRLTVVPHAAPDLGNALMDAAGAVRKAVDDLRDR